MRTKKWGRDTRKEKGSQKSIHLKYELRYDGIVEQSDDYDVLWKKSLLLQSDFVLYQCFQSKMNGIPVEEKMHVEMEKIIEDKIKSQWRKNLPDSEIEIAVREIERGHSKVVIARKHRVGVDTLVRIIREYEKEHQ